MPSWQPLRQHQQHQQHTNIYWISYELCDIRFNIPIGVRIAIALLVYEASNARTIFTDANRTRHWNSKYKINCEKNVSTPLLVINASLFPVHMMLLSLTLPVSLSKYFIRCVYFLLAEIFYRILTAIKDFRDFRDQFDSLELMSHLLFVAIQFLHAYNNLLWIFSACFSIVVFSVLHRFARKSHILHCFHIFRGMLNWCIHHKIVQH